MDTVINRKVVRKEIIHLIVPMILESILQISAGLISTAMIGRLLTADVSAQGVCIRVTDTLWCLYKGISIGATILIARSYGQGNFKKCRRVAEQTLFTEIPIALFFSIGLALFALPVLSFFSGDAALLAKAQEYMAIIIIGFPFIVIMSVVTASFQGCGDTKTPMVIAGIMNIVNIILGMTFIFGVGPIPAMGIRGAAMALVGAQVFSALLGLYLLYRKSGPFGTVASTGKFLSIDKECVKEIYTVGIPAALESMFWQFSAILLSKMIFSYGSNAFAAYQIGIQAETITEMPAIGFGTAATTLIARAIGKQDEGLRKVYFKELVGLSTKISIVTSIMLITLPTVFMNLMTTNKELVPIGAMYVMVMGFIQIPQNLSRIYNGSLRAAGYKKTPMFIAGFGIWIIRIPLCFLASTVFGINIISIWLIIALDQVVRFLLSVWIYHKKEKSMEILMTSEIVESQIS